MNRTAVADPLIHSPDGWAAAVASVHQHWPLTQWIDLRMVVAVSGGADSMFLLTALHTLAQQTNDAAIPAASKVSGEIIVAHYDHAVRDDSHRDAQLVAGYSQQLGLRCVVHRAGQANNTIDGGGRSDEASMRRNRYHFLRRTAHDHGARYVVLAHHRDDQAETVLQQLLRGTGISGLAGMRPFRPLDQDLVLARPMLGVSRAMIRAAVVERAIPYRDDPTNQSLAYRRNWLRHALLPQIETHFPGASTRLAHLADQLQPLHQSVIRAAHWLATQAQLEHRSNAIWFDPLPCRQQPDVVIVEMLRASFQKQGWSWQAVDAFHLSNLLSMIRGSPPATWNLPGQLRAQQQRRDRLVVESLPSP
jgi:tRNA(Ile)-lysidine synthase